MSSSEEGNNVPNIIGYSQQVSFDNYDNIALKIAILIDNTSSTQYVSVVDINYYLINKYYV